MSTLPCARAAVARAARRQSQAVARLVRAGVAPIDLSDTFAVSAAMRALNEADAALDAAQGLVHKLEHSRAPEEVG